MEIKIKFGDKKLKFSDKDFKKKLNNNEIPFENLMEFFSKSLENMPQYLAGYYKGFTKVFEQYMDFNIPKIMKMPDSPDAFPANGHDVFNYVARYGSGNFHIQAIIRLDGRLDFDKLKKAVRISVDVQPVFGCRLIEADPPYWQRIKDIDNVKFCTCEEVTDADEAVNRFLEKHMDMDHDPMVKVKLIRTEQYDILGIKVNHACCDGAGIKEYTQLLADIYSNLDQYENISGARINIRGREDQDRLLQSLGIKDSDAIWIPGSDIMIPTWAFPWMQGTSNITRFVICRLLPDQLEGIVNYAKSKGATTNDMILTAYYRAMLKMGQPIYGVPMGINITVDLRRYLPDNKTQAIRNFSGSVNTLLSMVENETFSDTLSRVSYIMKEVKSGSPGLQSAIGLERLEKTSFKDILSYYKVTSMFGKKQPDSPPFTGNRCVPALSNLGIISKSLIKFSDATVIDYYIIPPVVSAPGILLVANTYNGVLTLALGFFENTILQEDVEKLLNSIKDELLEGCLN